MNEEPTSTPPQEKHDNKWKKRHARLLRIGNWLTIPIYFFLRLVPSYFVMTAQLPPPEQLNVSGGKLVLQWTGKKGYMTGIEKDGQAQFFTCAGWSAGRHDCLRDAQSLKGKSATIWWFEQPIYLFQTLHSVARLEVEGVQRIGYEDTKSEMQRLKREEPWWDFGLLVFVVVVVVYCNKLASKIERRQDDN